MMSGSVVGRGNNSRRHRGNEAGAKRPYMYEPGADNYLAHSIV